MADDDDFYLIYQTYWRVVRSFFTRRGFLAQDADDLTQDTFFRVFRSMKSYEDRNKLAAWLFTIARNVCRAEWERRGTRKRSGVEVPYVEEPGDGENDDGGAGQTITPERLAEAPIQEEQLESDKLRERLSIAIRILPLRQRQCLTLQLRGHRYKEIACLLRIKRETVKKHLAVGRTRLAGTFNTVMQLDPVECQCLKLRLRGHRAAKTAALLGLEPEDVRKNLKAVRQRLQELRYFDLSGLELETSAERLKK